jgi:hypothetical protein
MPLNDVFADPNIPPFADRSYYRDYLNDPKSQNLNFKTDWPLFPINNNRDRAMKLIGYILDDKMSNRGSYSQNKI